MNQADGLIFSTKKQLEEYGEKISEGNRTAITEAITKLEEAHKAENLEEIDAAIEGVNQAWAAASQEIYAASQAEAAAGGEPGADAGGGKAEPSGDAKADADEEEGAVDAEFEVVEDDDK